MIGGPKSAPGDMAESQASLTALAIAPDVDEVDNLPPRAATPTRSRGTPWHPMEPFRSLITGRWFTIADAPKRPKRFQTRLDPTRLTWNINKAYRKKHRKTKREAKKAGKRRAKERKLVLQTIRSREPQIIDLVSPVISTPASSIAITTTLDLP